MAVYTYIYAGFPEREPRKYYVGDYRGSNAYTYQVMPQLQREFEQLGYEDGDELAEGRFKDLRRSGHLYTSNRSGDRTPLFGRLANDQRRELWRVLGRWVGGELWPGDVDWRELGANLRQALSLGLQPPEDIRTRLEELGTSRERSWTDVYETLRREHLDAVWYLRVGTVPSEAFRDLPSRDWEPFVTEFDSSDLGEPPDMATVVRESRPPTEAASEAEWLARLARAAGGDGSETWEELLAATEVGGERYDTIATDEGEAMRVPVEPLYEVQWTLAEAFDALRLHHESAPIREVRAPRPLHFRFHDGAAVGVRMQLGRYPDGIGRPRLRREVEGESAGGVFSDWSEQGRRALVELAVDPATDALAPSAPCAEVMAEIGLWRLDDALDRLTAEAFDSRWRYSRLGDELVLSAAGARPDGAVEQVVERALDAVEAHDLRRPGHLERFRAGSATTVGGLRLTDRRNRPVELPEQEAERLTEAADRRFDGRQGADDTTVLERGWLWTGDIRYRALAEPETEARVRALLTALTMEQFEEAAMEGWYDPPPDWT